MGTSVNQRSPGTDNWRMVQEIYRNPDIPIDQALRTLWRAASNRNEQNLADLLSRPEVGALVRFVTPGTTPAEAMSSLTGYIAREGISSLAADIAKRAVLQSVGKEHAREQFVQRLFSEATAYLVARDIPGYVGSGARFRSLDDARGFSRAMADRAAEAVSRTEAPRDFDAATWPTFVRSVIESIRRRP